MIYKHEKFGDSKHYSLMNNGMGMWTLREFADRIHRQTEMTLTSEEKISFEQMLKKGGWKAK